jgi:hypothetical protein
MDIELTDYDRIPPPPSYPPPPLSRPVAVAVEAKPITATMIADALARNRAAFEYAKQKATNVFMIGIFVIGLITFIVSWNVDKDIQRNESVSGAKACTSTNLKNANKIVLCLSTAMITSATFYVFGKCDSPESVHYKYYVYMSLIIGIMLVILGAIISQQSTQEGCATKSHPEIIWILGLLVSMLSGGLIFYMNKKN